MSSNGSLSYEEQRAKLRLEPSLGELRRLDTPGTSGAPDFEVMSGPAIGGVLEATEWLDEDRARQRGPIAKQREWRVATQLAWSVGVRKHAQVRDLLGHPGLEAVLVTAEMQGQRHIGPSTSSEDVVDLLNVLHIDHVLGYPAKPGREGLVRITWGTAAGWGWDGFGVGRWIREVLLPSGLITGKVEKLVRSGRQPTHLYVGLDGRMPEGFGVSSALDASRMPGGDAFMLPPVPLPSGLDALWIWPDMPGPGLRVDAAGSWGVIDESEAAAAALWRNSTGWR